MGRIFPTFRQMAGGLLAGWAFAYAAGSAPPLQAAETGSRPQTAALIPAPQTLRGGDEGAATLPKYLSDKDVQSYRRIFSLQEDAHWKDADKLIGQLQDKVLLGNVLAQRYLHPQYKSTYKELHDWMADYADLPDAGTVYKLALAKKPAKAAAPRGPAKVAPPENDGDSDDEWRYSSESRKKLSEAERRKSADLQAKIKGFVKKDNFANAKKLLLEDDTKKVLSAVEYDRLRMTLGQAYFNAGQDEAALELLTPATARSGRSLTNAHWVAGLAAWRLKKLDAAAKHFEAVAKAKGESPWISSAGAFWAARTHLRNKQPELYNKWLGEAATYQRTFYGLLALRLLGLEPTFRWTSPPLDDAAIAEFKKAPRGKRSLALVQIGEMGRAQQELRNLAVGADATLARGIMALAANTGMAGLAMKLNGTLYPNGGGFDGAAYPITNWKPEGGFRVDRALVFALIRQESAFNPNAKSPAGAHGLMQLMPGTASFVAGDRSLAGAKKRNLLDPEYNLSLGQRYVEILRDDNKIEGGLFQIIAAWNGGPGNLNKWRRKVDSMDDSLFFIESIPSYETRGFVERVLTNLWIYRDRFGQPNPSLDAIAAGDWPQYEALDGDVQIAETNGAKKR
jgi:soluble lytic murein transglycosylase